VKDWTSALGSKNPVPDTRTDVGKKSTEQLHKERASFNSATLVSFDPADLNGIDLLYIPGAPVAAKSQQTDVHGLKATPGFKTTEANSRDAFEAKIIEVAMNRGIPILAVCAGSWRLIESYGGQVRELSPTELGTHHNSASVWSCNHSVNVLSNQEAPGLVTSAAHGVPIDEGRQQLLGANSTHWAVTDVQHSKIQEGINRGQIDPTKATFTKRQTGLGQTSDSLDPSQLLKPVAFEPGTYTVEAFESSFGVPIVGTQWHPESFLPGMKGNNEKYANQTTITSSREIFRLMILAAVTSKVKRLSVVPQLREIFLKGGPNLRHVEPVVKKAMCVYDPTGSRKQVEAVDLL
jgi:putative glutamine amidotransferase